MSGITKTSIITLSLAVLVLSSCKHSAPFPELDDGKFIADEQNVVYDDSIKEEAKIVMPKSTNKPVEKTSEIAQDKLKDVAAPKKAEVKQENKNVNSNPVKKVENAKLETVKEIAKEEVKGKADLTVPSMEIEENTSQIVISSKAPSVITDIDLTEMDSAGVTKVIKPTTQTRTILSTNKKIHTVQSPSNESKDSGESNVVYLAETIYFNNSVSTVDSSYYSKLKNIVKEAQKHNGKIIVQGFASSRTRDTDVVTHKMINLKVSIARAQSVAKLLAQFGMPKSRIITEGLSDSRPAYQEVMPEGERLNRRAEVYISY